MSRFRCLDLPPSLVVDQVTPSDNTVQIEASLRDRSAVCPDCHVRTQRIHSLYRRTLSDLPWQGRRVTLQVSSFRLYCNTAGCRRRTFVIPLSDMAVPYGRHTMRLTDLHHYVAHALGGSAGARMAERLRCPVSADTLIRRLLSRMSGKPSARSPRVLGVDDWAWRRGHHYGTILVDLEKNDVVNLLPDRQADTLAAWLVQNPGIEIIARDRAGAYADACYRGAPSAVQVTDRWHLLRNLSDAFVAVVDRYARTARQIMQKLCQSASTDTGMRAQPSCLQKAQAPTRNASQAAQSRRETRFNDALALKAEGHGLQAIADMIGVERKTLRRWFRQGHAPTWKRTTTKPGILAPYTDYLDRRWQEGCHNATILWRELVSQGFTGKYGIVWKWLTIRQAASPQQRFRRHAVPPLGRKLARLLLTDPGTLADQQTLFVGELLAAEPQLEKTTRWVRKMQNLLCRKSEDNLRLLLKEGRDTLLSRLVPALERDAAAIRASLVTSWTTSPVEGQISRLKMIKRTMFGRAGFELLRARVLPIS
ncbi:ISL3 family transposase [Komagataeibacter diospyri]|uniref:ISL3 family transposase n=1 Tax=Komagataeibacter diospyri TaxID=1932662 RepID=UPI0037566DEB